MQVSDANDYRFHVPAIDSYSQMQAPRRRSVEISAQRTQIRVQGRSERLETDMKATIWHNPKCGTSRKTLAILENLSTVDLTVVEYLKDPPSAQKLAQLYESAGITPAEGLRLRGTDAEERGLPDADADAILAAMAADPILIERPLVETEKGVRLCRPQDRVLEIL
tara:strand:+ start:288 stop:785 length:498 start_codon:yes stop_codon:yes gene_type:complete